MIRLVRYLIIAHGIASTLCTQATSASLPCPSLEVIENTLLTTAKQDFNGDATSFEAAASWNAVRLRGQSSYSHLGTSRAPHLACADYRNGPRSFSQLQSFLSSESVRRVSNSKESGSSCFLVTASHAEAETLSNNGENMWLTSFAPFPSALKIAPGVIEYVANDHDDDVEDKMGKTKGTNGTHRRVPATHGALMRRDNVQGLTVELTPGALKSTADDDATPFITDLLEDFMSASIDLYATNFWSDPSLAEGEHLATPGGAVRGRGWTEAAAVVHELTEASGTSPGDICSWNSVGMHYSGHGVLVVQGLDHLLHSGRGAGGTSHDGEAEDLHIACFVGLVSFLAARAEVLKISPFHGQELLNAAARAVIQSAGVTSTPLTAAGLDGSGEIIQVVDTGLDETSCFFVDEDGLEIDHGYFFNEIGQWASNTEWSFDGGDFPYFPERRKVIQYIDMINPDSPATGFVTVDGDPFYLLPPDDFGEDGPAGHGTHCAGSAAGSTLNTPAVVPTCSSGQTMGCVGGCIGFTSWSLDDLAPFTEIVDLDRLCPALGCQDGPPCLGDDESETLSENGGMAQGAKLSIFDVFNGESGLSHLPGNDLWFPCMEAGCKLHSNSYGATTECTLTSLEPMYDEFMYENPENLLIFAAGNDGDYTIGSPCTILSPALGKNSLTVGASTSGDTRHITTLGGSGIDTIADFSSRGFSTDGRIKPEVVAPGDLVYSAASDGTGSYSCRLWAYKGTSMSCPIVAGASALVRQYFVDDSFYAAHVKERGLCDEGFICEGFSPSSATVKAMLINSANLMGGSSDPDGSRGFGRIHLEAGMPLSGEEDLVLFVADSADTNVAGNTDQDYVFNVDAGAGLDFRATLSWIDKPATSVSSVQLIHDLDLHVMSPSGQSFTMWSSGAVDDRNVNERVIVDADDVETGSYTITVSAKSLDTATQSYSLVVTGAIISSAPATAPTPAPAPGSEAGKCSDGTTDGVDGNGVVCCTPGCTQCSGPGCATSSAAAGLDASDCCGGTIKASGKYCDDTNTAPCIIGGGPSIEPGKCSDGTTDGVDGNGVVCCTPGCTQCSGPGCATSSAAAGLDASDCCGGTIKASGKYCDDTNTAPCIIGGGPSTEPGKCSDGTTDGVDGNGVVCCTPGCTQCGGPGCATSSAAAGLDASDCCGGTIKDSGKYCDDTNTAPCIIGSAR